MKRHIQMLIFTLTCLFPLPVILAETLLSAPPDLEKMINEALEKNGDILSIEAEIESLRQKAPFDGALADPRLGFALLNLPEENLSLKQEPMTQKQVYVAQYFPWAGKRKLRSDITFLQADSLYARLQDRKLILATDISDAYYEIWFIFESIKINQKLAEMIEQVINVTTTKYSSGRGLQQDIFQAQVELDWIRDELIRLKRAYRLIENTINGLLNRESFMGIPPPATLSFTEKVLDLQQLKKKVLTTNPELAALKIEIEEMSTSVSLVKKDYYPDLDLKLAYGQRDEDESGRKLDNFISLSASLNIPLWKRNRQDKNVLSKKAAVRAAQKRYNNLARTLPHKVDAVITDIVDTSERFELYQNALIPETRQWARAATYDYEVGRIEFDTMIKARIQALLSELKAKEYLFNIYKKHAELEALLGGLALME